MLLIENGCFFTCPKQLVFLVFKKHSYVRFPLISKMAASPITALCNRNVIYICQIRAKHLELTLGYMGKFFSNGSMTMKFHILNVLYDLEAHAKDGR